ncbi:hypothetical protein L210DRAFT_3585591, partial [Boletus edulis BED1]
TQRILATFQRGACIAWQLLFVSYSLIVSSIGRHLEITAIFCKEHSLHPPWVFFVVRTISMHHTLLPSLDSPRSLRGSLITLPIPNSLHLLGSTTSGVYLKKEKEKRPNSLN